MTILPLQWRSASSEISRTTNVSASQELPGWFWRTPEGQAFIRAASIRSGPDPLDDPEIGWQREED